MYSNLFQKKFETRSLGLLYRITINEDYDIDFVSGRAEDPEYGYSLLYDPETNQRQTGKVQGTIKSYPQRQSHVLRLVKLWKLAQTFNMGFCKIRKSRNAFIF